jgi:hypothetical protein
MRNQQIRRAVFAAGGTVVLAVLAWAGWSRVRKFRRATAQLNVEPDAGPGPGDAEA